MTRLLLIDDEEINVRVLSMSLRSDGYEVFTATSGAEGLEIFDREKPEIVLTDIKMPGMDGIEVLKRVKARDPDTEVIIITGHGDIDNAIEALKYGASDFINKPIRDEVLAIALSRAEEKVAIHEKLKAHTKELKRTVDIATRELRRKSSFQIKLIKSANDGIIATDKGFTIVIFNPAAEEIFGYTKQEAVGKLNVRDLYNEDVLTVLDTKRQPPHIIKAPPSWETEIISKTGEAIPVRFSGTALYEKHEMVGSVAFFQDLREIKRLEAELIRTERLAAIGQTVAGMAHSVKNILHGFKGGSYLVNQALKTEDTDRLKQGWGLIQRNIDQTSELVMNLLSYSKERKPQPEPCDPNAVAEEVCRLLSETARENDVELITEPDPEIGTVMIDPHTLHGALMNLVSNAIDACLFDESTDKDWRVTVRTALGGDRNLIIEVEDNGAGMSEAVSKKIFTSFFSTKGHRGTGLGLLVTRKNVEEHGGAIEVSSREGEGTVFTIRLPFKEKNHSK
ncbi:MAG: response regulator [Thermodesulfobacteriota bacterium]